MSKLNSNHSLLIWIKIKNHSKWSSSKAKIAKWRINRNKAKIIKISNTVKTIKKIKKLIAKKWICKIMKMIIKMVNKINKIKNKPKNKEKEGRQRGMILLMAEEI